MKDSLGNQLKPGDWIKVSDESVKDAQQDLILRQLLKIDENSDYSFTCTGFATWRYAVKMFDGTPELKLEPWMPEDSKRRRKSAEALQTSANELAQAFSWEGTTQGREYWSQVFANMKELARKLEKTLID